VIVIITTIPSVELTNLKIEGIEEIKGRKCNSPIFNIILLILLVDNNIIIILILIY